jgi:DNA-binding NarL/FixJ family response regulator
VQARGTVSLAGGSCSAPAATQNVRAHLRILIVDDSAIIVHCMRDYLDSQDAVQVIGTANTGSKAVRKAVLLKPDLVLMDVNMPDMNGLQATALLRQQLINTRIILMTLDDKNPAKAIAHAQGAHGFIAKARLANDLMSEIHRVCQLPSMRSQKHRIALPALAFV